MLYNTWTKIDSGREGLWKNKVLFGVLPIIAAHEGEDIYDAASPIYAELEAKLPGTGWMKAEGGNPRPLFRDYAKPWTATGLIDIANQKFQLTSRGKNLVSGQLSPKEFYRDFLTRWTESDERPFTVIASAFLNSGGPLSFRDLYFGVMLGYRKGDDIHAALATSRVSTAQMEDTPKRRLLILLAVMEAAGAIAREDPKQSDAEAKWIIWDSLQIVSLAKIGDVPSTTGAAALSEVLKGLVPAHHADLSKVGLSTDLEMVCRLAGALLAKRFSILTGLAGSGKTKLAEAFAMWICESAEQFQLVAVGADWTSNENLLGYPDALSPGKYVVPGNGVLQLLLRAIADPSKPHFLILDEMNLSHVERYFADFLSAIESPNAKLALHGQGLLKAGSVDIPERLALPTNLFIIGTVNVDETTYMFSPKVLDRANVIEFRATKDQMADFLDEPNGIDLDQLRAKGVAYAPAFVSRAQADADISTVSDASGLAIGLKLKDDLLEVFATLEAIGGEFGFRTAKEIARFVVIHHELSDTTWEYRHALDAQVLQKLMPKLHGSARKLSGVLDGLKAFGDKHSLPLTLGKLQRMQARLKRDGFTSFAEN